MDFTYDDEQIALRDSVRSLVGKAYADFGQRREIVATEPGYDEGLWRKFAEMGLLGLPFSEEDGGMGAGAVEVGLVSAELGRVLAPEPFLSMVVMAGGAVAAAGTAQQRADVLPALVAGERILALAHDEPGRRWVTTAKGVTAAESQGSWLLTGTKEPVLHGARADQLVVSAALPAGGTGLFLVDGDATGLVRSGYATYEGGRAAHIALNDTPATPLGKPGADQSTVIGSVLDHARMAICHEALGAMDVALSTTTEYLKSRKQFGVPLSTFQALTFRASDMYVSLELTRSIVLWATMVLADADGDPGGASQAVARASLQVSRASRHLGQEAIQLHGGIAMTAEYLVGNLTARLTVLDHLLGDGRHHLARLAAGVSEYASVEPLDS
ncbi:MAG: acyl-CoA dehydrogenase family protein [Knoellia sp.]